MIVGDSEDLEALFDSIVQAGSEEPAAVPEAKPAAAASAPEDDRWRIAGLYGRGRQAGVLVLSQDPAKPPQRLKVGDKLPTGESIQAVEGNEVVVRKGKKVERFGVEQREK